MDACVIYAFRLRRESERSAPSPPAAAFCCSCLSLSFRITYYTTQVTTQVNDRLQAFVCGKMSLTTQGWDYRVSSQSSLL